MIEIAVCLAIIGFALVAIIGVLPLGMNTQRDVREQTVINQDASVLLNDIRTAARADNLTNNVYAITNYCALYTGGTVSYPNPPPGWTTSDYLTNGANIVGLLSTPEFTLKSNGVAQPFPPYDYDGWSNHIVAYVRSISGLAAEKPPQTNSIMVNNSLTYRVYCVNAAAAFDTNNLAFSGTPFARQLAANLRELRLTFLWPQLPNGNIGGQRQTFRVSVAGQLTPTNDNGQVLYFYQPQSFTNAP